MDLNSTHELILAIKNGEMIILLDDEDRENEGDIIIAAEKIENKHIAFMAKHASGLICLCLSDKINQKLELPFMGSNNQSHFGTNFTVSIEAPKGVSTGISAADRVCTIKSVIKDNADSKNWVTPGHIFPIIAREGGVLVRAGHTEASVDLAKMANLKGAAVIVEIMNSDGTMARYDDLIQFAQKHQLKIGTIADIIKYRITNETSIKTINEWENLNLYNTDFNVKLYKSLIDHAEHLVLSYGNLNFDEPINIRVHRMNPLTDYLNSKNTNNRWTLSKTIDYIKQEGQGIIVLLDINEPGKLNIEDQINDSINTKNKEQDNKNRQWLTTGIGSQILVNLGVKRINLLSQNIVFKALSGFGLEIEKFIPPK